jgi:uncharacterized protein YndB with AHSA1/START domain
MREGSGETLVAVAPDVAFAYLADPRHTQEWFAGATLAEQPTGEPRAGMAWRFVLVRSDNRVVPVRMAVYEPPSRFVWRTTLPWPRTNLEWEMRCDPEDDDAAHTHLHMTIRITPGPVGWLALWVSPRAYQPNPALQAQRAVERARDALIEQTTQQTMDRPPARKPSEKRGRQRG